jgi:anti-sigma factor RsiW
MNCRHARHLLDSYLDGELAPSLRAEVHAHRLTCADCQRAMAVVEVAGDVIRTDSPEPDLSLGFTDRVLGAMKPPQEPRVVRIMRLRRAAAFLGPMLSAAAVWMIVVMVTRPLEPVSVSPPVTMNTAGATATAGVVVQADPTRPASAGMGYTLAEDLISPAMATWRDTRRSTRDLATLGWWVLSSASEAFGNPPQVETKEGESGVLSQAESMLRDMLAPKSAGDAAGEGPDVL